MIDPQRCAERIVLNDDVAKELFDLLLAATEPGFRDGNEYDEIMSDLFKRIQSGRDARDAYAKTRLQRTDLYIADSTAAAGSN